MESDSHNDGRKSNERPSGAVIPLPGIVAKDPEPPAPAAREPERDASRDDALADPLDLLTHSLGAWGRAVHRQARDIDGRVDDVAQRVTAVGADAARMRGEVDAHDRRLDTGERRIADAGTALDEHKARLATHAAALDAGTARHDQLETQLATTAAAFRADAARLRAELAGLAEQNNELTRRLGQLRLGLAAALIAMVAIAGWIGGPHLAALLGAGH